MRKIMELLKIFKKNKYTSIKKRSRAKKLGIEVKFLYDENDNGKYPDELVHCNILNFTFF